MTAESDIAADIATFLADQSGNHTSVVGYAVAGDMIVGNIGTGTNYGSTIYVDYKPPTPDNVICVFGYAGRAPDWTHDSRGHGRPGVQVWVRHTSAATGRTLIEEIFNELDGITNTTLSDVYYEGIFANQHPEPMGRDENGRAEFAVNFSVMYRRT